MFNKREQQESSRNVQNPSQPTAESQPQRSAPATGGRIATIGPSLAIQGELRGDEDLVVEGKFKGTIQLKKNTLTIGTNGSIDAEVYAHTILVDGTVNGNLYASERISIRKSARITGNLFAPRISLEDGARFRGSIDMDSENEAFRKAFAQGPSAAASPTPVKSVAPEAKKGAGGQG